MKNLSIKKQVEVALQEGLKGKGIPNFLEIGLKEINYNVKNVKNHIENTIFRKAGKALLKNYSKEELERHINNAGPYKVSIKENMSGRRNVSYKEDIINAIDRNIRKEDILELVITDEREKNEFVTRVITAEGYTLKKKGVLSISSKGCYYQIENLDKVIGLLFVLNSLISYIEKNKEMTYLAIYGAISRTQDTILVKTEIEKEEIIETYRKLNIDISQIVNVESFENIFSKLIKSIEDKPLRLKELYTVSTLKDKENNLSYVDIGSKFFSPRLFASIYDLVISANKEEESRAKITVSDKSDYAKSYEDKKNVPDFILEKMKDNAFVDYFDFVELDELVDLAKFDIIEDEWERFMEEVDFPISEKHSLRFRRLGNHKAGGLYFPHIKAVCVDLDNSNSLIHELFHMLDYSNEKLNYSETFEFRTIIEKYKIVMEREIEKLDEEDSLRQDWNSRKKFNKEYYLSPEEIFARTGEIYIRRIKGFDSPLVKGIGSLYPEEEKLEKMIEKYFNKVLA